MPALDSFARLTMQQLMSGVTFQHRLHGTPTFDQRILPQPLPHLATLTTCDVDNAGLPYDKVLQITLIDSFPACEHAVLLIRHHVCSNPASEVSDGCASSLRIRFVRGLLLEASRTVGETPHHRLAFADIVTFMQHMSLVHLF
jgi:hypothetical protein